MFKSPHVLGSWVIVFVLGGITGLVAADVAGDGQPTKTSAPSAWERILPDGPWRTFDGDHRVVCYAPDGYNGPSWDALSCVLLPYEIFPGQDLQDDPSMDEDDTALPDLDLPWER